MPALLQTVAERRIRRHGRQPSTALHLARSDWCEYVRARTMAFTMALRMPTYGTAPHVIISYISTPSDLPA